jgi:hypothetical protein
MTRTLRALLSVAAVPGLAAAACVPPPGDTGGDVYRPRDEARTEDRADVPDTITCSPGAVVCSGSTANRCNAAGDGWESSTPCVGGTPVCIDGVGCVVCRPEEPSCDGLTARRCLPDGSGWETIDECDPALDERCNLGYCTDLSDACESARLENSYEGCDYWPVQLSNRGLQDTTTFRYALVIGNRQSATANVEVRDASGVVATTTVAPASVRALEIAWNEELRSPPATSLARGAAFRLKSDVPVTVYQFNPLRYAGGTGLVPYSWSNDASLLLPRHVLTGDYIVPSRGTFMTQIRSIMGEPTVFSHPGIIGIVGVEDGTEVQVVLRARTQGDAAIPPYGPGDTATFTIDRHDALQILSEMPTSCSPTRTEPDPTDPFTTYEYCDLGPDFDLTGTEVYASKPVAVYSGHDCTFVPYDRWACDHLEEQIFPLQAWGTRYIASRSQPVVDEGNIYRIISGVDGNEIRFEPPAHDTVALDRTQWIEFESTEDFQVTGGGALLVVQFLVGQGLTMASMGDPAMALAVPVDQYRKGYNFLAPEDYRDDPAAGIVGQNWVNVIAPDGARVLLDGAEVGGFSGIAGSGFGVARVQIEGGSHAIDSDVEFGIMCYGYGNYTSYMYPGGLDVDKINII